MSASTIIEQLHLKPHPEGGYYRETFRATDTVRNAGGNLRAAGTAIYYLLEDHDVSHFHRLSADELWFFHEGAPLEILTLQGGGVHTICLGNNLSDGQAFQAVIPASTWFAARLKGGKGYSLVSCTVAPGFDFADFELATRSKLLHAYPHLKEVIAAFTR
ncbi:MAG TPA: cupin domain-containing protein [Cyclobacteriaceae bacterium]|nr:cupin domain-containing protein [Cyclobacteriaceae bacterium]